MRVVRHWNRLPTEIVNVLSLGVFNVRLDEALSNLVHWKVAEGFGTKGYLRSLPMQRKPFYDSVNEFRLDIRRRTVVQKQSTKKKKNQACSGVKEAFNFWKNLIPAVSANTAFEGICSLVVLLSLGGSLNPLF